MVSVRALANFGTHFESDLVGVKLSFAVGYDGISKLRADEIMARNETGSQTPRMYFICTPAHFSMCFESA